MKKTNPGDLLKNGLHLGHKKNKTHPKAQQYIFKTDKGVSIIDLFKTAELLDSAKKYVAQLGKEGKIVLFVATKKVAREPVGKLTQEHGLPHMTNKWVGGFLTNFPEVSKNIKRMNDMKAEQTSGEWDRLIKHERNRLEKKMNRISSIYSGVEKLNKLPDAMFILDIRKEKNALSESLQMNIPTVAVVDTNVNPDDVTHPIPANDDAVLSISYIADQIIGAYVDGMKKAPAEKTEKDSKAGKKNAEKKPAKRK